MRVEILPALVHFPRERCMANALEAFTWRKDYPSLSDRTTWLWLLRWAGAPA